MHPRLKSYYLAFIERLNQPQLKYRAGWIAIALVIGSLIYSGIAAATNEKNNERGTFCTHQLADIDRALTTICELKNIRTNDDLAQAIGPAPYDGLNPYLFGYKINGPAGKTTSLRCPLGGIYSIPGTLDSDLRPNDPICSYAKSNPSVYGGTYLHSLKANP